MRLDLFVIKNLPSLLKNADLSNPEAVALTGLPRSFWQEEIKLGNIKILNKLVKPSYNIDFEKLSSVNINWKKIKKNWNVFYREHFLNYPASLSVVLTKPEFLVINKPAGLSAHPVFPLNQNFSRDLSLIEVLRSFCPAARLVHRLDKETGGVLLVAKNEKAKNHFKKQFKTRQIKKVYFALVKGGFPYEKFRVEGMIGKSQKNPVLRRLIEGKIKDSSGDATKIMPDTKIINPKHSLTFGEKVISGTLDNLEKAEKPTNKIVGFWKKYLNSKQKYTLLKLTPQTGRTHQIRVHLKALGFPILGDKLYGEAEFKFLPFHCLHAYSLGWSDLQGKIYFAKVTDIILLK